MKDSELVLRLWSDLMTLEDCIQRALDGVGGFREREGARIYVESQLKQAEHYRLKIRETIEAMAAKLKVNLG